MTSCNQIEPTALNLCEDGQFLAISFFSFDSVKKRTQETGQVKVEGGPEGGEEEGAGDGAHLTSETSSPSCKKYPTRRGKLQVALTPVKSALFSKSPHRNVSPLKVNKSFFQQDQPL